MESTLWCRCLERLLHNELARFELPLDGHKMAFAFGSTGGDVVRSPMPNCTERAFWHPQKSTPTEVLSDTFCWACGPGVAATLREARQTALRTAQLRPTQRAAAAVGVHRPAAGVSTPDVSRPLLFGDSVLAWVRCSAALPRPAAPPPHSAPPPRPASLVPTPRSCQAAHGGLPPRPHWRPRRALRLPCCVAGRTFFLGGFTSRRSPPQRSSAAASPRLLWSG